MVRQRFYKYLLGISIIINLLLAMKYAKKIYWVYFEKEPFVTYKYDRDELFEKFETDTTDIIFLGNSITQHFEFFEFLKNTNVRNRGIGGETTSGALQRLSVLTKGQPNKMFLMLGINDLNSGRGVFQILNTYEKIIKKIQNESYRTQIIIESVLPVSRFKEKNFFSEDANDNIIKLNDGLRNLSIKHNVKYLELYDSFMGVGGLKPSLTIDGIHLNADGYDLMSKLIKPYLE